MLELAPDHPVEYDAWDLESWTRAGARSLTDVADVTIVDSGPLVGRVRVERRFGPSSSIVTYELRADSAQLDVHVELDWHHDEHLLSMAFPLDVRADMAMCDIQFGVVARPTHPSSPWDAAKFEVCAHRYVDVAEPGFGVAILNNGRYGHGVFDGAVRVSLRAGRELPRPARRPRSPRGDAGDPSRMVPGWPTSCRSGTPQRTVAGRERHGRRRGRPAAPPVVVVSGPDGGAAPGVEVDAVKLADDGTGDLIVRLHEACGNRIRISVATPQRIAAAWRCNLLEEPGRARRSVTGSSPSRCVRSRSSPCAFVARPPTASTAAHLTLEPPGVGYRRVSGGREVAQGGGGVERDAGGHGRFVERTRGWSGWARPSPDRRRRACHRGTSSRPGTFCRT